MSTVAEVQGKAALVMGAGNGLGEAIARKLCEVGAALAVASRELAVAPILAKRPDP